MRTISIINHKGGVGKTTITINLAEKLGRLGKKVLVIDMDFQANLTKAISNFDLVNKNIFDVIVNNFNINEIIVKSTSGNFDLAPAGLSLREAEKILVNEMKNDQRLLYSLKKINYDIVIIDNSPSSGILAYNSIFASNFILIPVEAEILSLMGIPVLQTTLKKIEQYHNNLEILGTVISNFDKRKVANDVFTKKLKDYKNLRIFNTKIRTNSRISDSFASKKTIYNLKDKKGIEDFDNLAIEVLERI